MRDSQVARPWMAVRVLAGLRRVKSGRSEFGAG